MPKKTFNIVHLKKARAYLLTRLGDLESHPDDLVTETVDERGRSTSIVWSLPNIRLETDGEVLRCTGLAHHIPLVVALSVVQGLASALKLPAQEELPLYPFDPNPDQIEGIRGKAASLQSQIDAFVLDLPSNGSHRRAAITALVNAQLLLDCAIGYLGAYLHAAWESDGPPRPHYPAKAPASPFRKARTLAIELALLGHEIHRLNGITLAGCASRSTRGLLDGASDCANQAGRLVEAAADLTGVYPLALVELPERNGAFARTLEVHECALSADGGTAEFYLGNGDSLSMSTAELDARNPDWIVQAAPAAPPDGPTREIFRRWLEGSVANAG